VGGAGRAGYRARMRTDHPSAGLPVPLVTVAGPPPACGAGYGAAATGLILANLDLYLRRFQDEAALDRAAVRIAGAAFRRATVGTHPRVAAMLDGLADGAGAAVEEIYALNARTELLNGGRFDSGRGGVRVRDGGASPPDGADGGCTTVGVLGTHTDTGHLLLGQNWDWYPDQREAMVLLATRDERGHRVLTLTEAGMLAKTGLNSAGVGVCVNLLGCDRDGLPPGQEPGIPYHVLLRAVLEADSVGWAARTVCRSPRSASINLLIGQAGPGGGELLDLELVPGDAGWLHPVDGLLTHANHLETRLAVRDVMKDLGGSSLFRSARARRLLATRAGAGPLDLAALADVLHDHLSFPLGICRHVDERDTPDQRSESVYSVLLDLDDQRLGVAAGPPCGHDHHWLDLMAL